MKNERNYKISIKLKKTTEAIPHIHCYVALIIMRYVKEQIVKGCYHECKFFGSDMDGMKCKHPYFEDKGAYENMIITQQNSRNGNIPEKCPLKNNSTEIVLRIKLSED